MNDTKKTKKQLLAKIYRLQPQLRSAKRELDIRWETGTESSAQLDALSHSNMLQELRIQEITGICAVLQRENEWYRKHSFWEKLAEPDAPQPRVILQ